MKPSYIIVIGASAGGIKAIQRLIENLDHAIDAAVLIVNQFTGKARPVNLVSKLQSLGIFNIAEANDHDRISRGKIYVAPQNAHLMLDGREIRLGHGPEEGNWRPSVDVLFRSAAATWSNRVIGIVLTGLMSDGTSGMEYIRKSGGVTIVQDPAEAEFPEMPLSVVHSMQPDYVLKLGEMGNILDRLTQSPVEQIKLTPRTVSRDATISNKVVLGATSVEKHIQKPMLSCPDCGGVLQLVSEINGVQKYYCPIGHAFTAEMLAPNQDESLINTLWIALRIMEERRQLFIKMEHTHWTAGINSNAVFYHQKAVDLESHISLLKEMLTNMQKEKPL